MKVGYYRALVSAVFLLILFLSACSGSEPAAKTDKPKDFQKTQNTGHNCTRIVSLSPSLTETIYALGLGDNLVGVTRFCNFPEDANKKERVGGYYDPNYEAILSLKPSIVFILAEQDKIGKHLQSLGLKTFTLNHQSVTGIIESFEKIGSVCSVETAAKNLTVKTQETVTDIKQKIGHLEKTRTLISVGRDIDSGRVKNVYISGRDGYYNELIGLAGGANAYEGMTLGFPMVSYEGFIAMNPTVIFDMIPDIDKTGLSRKQITAQWNELSEVEAVKTGRVHIFSEDYAVIPGPRFVILLQKMAQLLHPEVDW